MVLAALPLGLALGLAVGTLGGGGSVLAVPLLVYVLGQPVQEATTASLVVVAAGALTGVFGHARAGRVCWRHAAVLTLAALPGIVAGTILSEAISGRALMGAFAVLMLVAAVAIWRTAGGRRAAAGDCALPVCPPLRLPLVPFTGAGIGLLTGFLGIGGGFLIVPTLVMALALAMRLAVGTSLAIVAATSVIGLMTHLGAGRELDVPVTAALTGACIAGALAGATLAGRIPQERLTRGFALVISGVAGYLLVSVTFLGGPPGVS
ncbi:protein of unknown function DUF81 [Conexibacter woesei DSM 14684]|uniref:Probable membrane transporter protein n=1 Tax=Conexibacter woesei (strain DSM 14684 / CCUG 47730 / CIP 108061 / JCM 11494 / NBRC 100937 / ID131577) TaxID=469383 RepID=D3F7I9_CONWI|nr:protein of unknown function DUF81 [Conexibacter woesei DSM 14684]